MEEKKTIHHDKVIEVREMTMGYGETILLNRISFEVNRGEIFVILGGSG